MAMDEKLWHSFKVCDYTFNFMAMSCLLQFIILWHLSKVTILFLVVVLVACVHYNYKWVANLVVDFQISSNECNAHPPCVVHIYLRIAQWTLWECLEILTLTPNETNPFTIFFPQVYLQFFVFNKLNVSWNQMLFIY
jgi:hypothetical protein